MPKKVFISYRREDTSAAAGRIYDRLCSVLTKRNVFFDVSAIAGGEDFERRIASTIQASDATIVMIGARWAESRQDGEIRLFRADDHVRAEVRAALAHAKLTLPVLVDGAPMPRGDQLPDDIRLIAAKNAMPLRHASFDDDAENIVKTILGVPDRERIWNEHGKWRYKIAYSAAGAILALVLLTLAALLHFAIFDRPLSASIGEAGATLLLILSVVVGVWLGIAWEAKKRRREL